MYLSNCAVSAGCACVFSKDMLEAEVLPSMQLSIRSFGNGSNLRAFCMNCQLHALV